MRLLRYGVYAGVEVLSPAPAPAPAPAPVLAPVLLPALVAVVAPKRPVEDESEYCEV